ncbi:hypothetical protein PAXINDRAFT_7813 [Paxillus involutus ATCC 200175]|nr:hypothetical protein PAXINDRAFT_7813 [Paxillus involutus ATCC 200175]
MSLFEWSTPERRARDRDLPIIPNEIHLIIFEYIAPTSTRLSPKQILTLSNLFRVCRFFANLCFPRIFECLEFTPCIFVDNIPPARCNDADRMASRARILCQQIAAKEPLALFLSQCVKICHFTDWKDANESWCTVHTLSQLCISGMAHMKNIRKLQFFRSFVKKAHWDAITTLGSLEELVFTRCNFVDGPADVDPGKRLKVKVPCLLVYGCDSGLQPWAVIDARHVRTLTMDLTFADQVDWISETALIELHVFDYSMDMASHMRVGRILRQIPQFIQVLRLPTDTFTDMDESLFEDPAWKKMPLLRSLTLDEAGRSSGMPLMTVVREICEGVRVLKCLQSFTLSAWGPPHLFVGVSPVEVRRTIQERLNDIPALNFVDIYGTTVRLVDGEWIDVGTMPCNKVVC